MVMTRKPQVPPTAQDLEFLYQRIDRRGEVLSKGERRTWSQRHNYSTTDMINLMQRYPLRIGEVRVLLGMNSISVRNYCRKGLSVKDETGKCRYVLPCFSSHTNPNDGNAGSVRFSPRDILHFAQKTGLEVFDLLMGDYYRQMFEQARASLLVDPVPTGLADPTRLATYPYGYDGDDQAIREQTKRRIERAAPRQGIAHRDDGSKVVTITEIELATLLQYTPQWTRLLRKHGIINPEMIVLSDRDRVLGHTAGTRGVSVLYDGEMVARALSGEKGLPLFMPGKRVPAPKSPRKPKVKKPEPVVSVPSDETPVQPQVESDRGASWL